jgi:hypothetical protein
VLDPLAGTRQQFDFVADIWDAEQIRTFCDLWFGVTIQSRVSNGGVALGVGQAPGAKLGPVLLKLPSRRSQRGPQLNRSGFKDLGLL